MKKTILITVLLSIAILAGCSNDLANELSEENGHGGSDNQPYADLPVEEANFKGINPFTFKEDNYQEQNIYGAGKGKILIKSDKLYLFDVQDQKLVAETPLKSFKFPERYYITEDGYCVVGIEFTESKRIAKAYFYNKNLDIVQELNLNEVLGESRLHIPVGCIAVTKSGKKIAYATSTGLFLYDLTKETKETLLNYSLENMDINKGLIFLKDIAFFDNDTKLAFIGTSFEEKGENGQTTFGTISADDSGIVNEKADLPNLKHMAVSDDYLAFSEDDYVFGDGKPTGKVIMIDSTTQQILRHTLHDRDEGSNVFLSEKGKYFMSYLQNDNKKITFRIYDSKTGKLIREMKQEFAGKTDEKYMKTYIEIFDDINKFIAVSTFYNSEPVVTINEF